MRALIFAAARASYESRSTDLPKIISSLVASCLRGLSLRYCHFQHLLKLIMIYIFIDLINQPILQGGDLSPYVNSRRLLH